MDAPVNAWEDVTLDGTWEETKTSLRTLSRSDDLAAAVYNLSISTCAGVGPDEYPCRSLCNLLAKAIRKMSRLRELHITQTGFHSPAVIAALCAQPQSQLEELTLSIGSIQDTDDLSVLEGIKLTTGRLKAFNLVSGTVTDWAEALPKAYVEAVARIINSSAPSIESFQYFCASDITPLLYSVRSDFPELKAVRGWIECFASPCFASVYLKVKDMELDVDLSSARSITTMGLSNATWSPPKCFPCVERLHLVCSGACLNAVQLNKLLSIMLVDMKNIVEISISSSASYHAKDHLVERPEVERDALTKWSPHNPKLHRVAFEHSGYVTAPWGHRGLVIVTREWQLDCHGWTLKQQRY